MKCSEYVKGRGLKSLQALSSKSGVSTRTLQNWYNNKRELFDIVLNGVYWSEPCFESVVADRIHLYYRLYGDRPQEIYLSEWELKGLDIEINAKYDVVYLGDRVELKKHAEYEGVKLVVKKGGGEE